MSQRRKFNSGFKFKVVVEALSERYTMQELARKHDLHPNQISSWKKEFLQKGADFFGKETPAEEKKEDVDKLYKVIGQQKMEIDFLSKIAKPDFGYITNFGKAHLEGFGGEEGVIKGKSELYDYLKKNEKTVFVNCDDKKQVELTEGIRKITFGSDPKAEFSFKFSKSINGNCPEIIYDSTHFKSQLTGDYNQSNLAAAIAIGLKFEVPIEDIKAAIEEYIPDNNRSQIIHQNDQKIILDAYNANPSSMQAALLNFSKMKGDKAIILGDMFELGDAAAKEHQAIIDLAEKLEFQTIFLIGKFFHQIAVNYKNIRSFENREAAEKYFSENPIQEKQLLIKGSRGMALEKLLEVFSS